MTERVIIDDQDARRQAVSAARRLDRLRARNAVVGSIRLLSTEDVLVGAVRNVDIVDRDAMRKLYARLRQLDDGLVSIDQTRLITNALWDER